MAMKMLLAAAAAAGALALSLGAVSPASAALTLSDVECDLYSATGCQFTDDGPGGANDNDTGAVEDAYNNQHVEGPAPATIDLVLLGKLEAGPDFPNDLSSYDWTFDDVLYVSVKGGQTFVLYAFNSPQDFGTATNQGLLKGNGNCCAGISHITFYGGADGGIIPEPGTWALMILGFGGAGAMLRRRRMVVA